MALTALSLSCAAVCLGCSPCLHCHESDLGWHAVLSCGLAGTGLGLWHQVPTAQEASCLLFPSQGCCLVRPGSKFKPVKVS